MYIFMLAGGPISWKSEKQTCVALSSNEAEFMRPLDKPYGYGVFSLT